MGGKVLRFWSKVSPKLEHIIKTGCKHLNLLKDSNVQKITQLAEQEEEKAEVIAAVNDTFSDDDSYVALKAFLENLPRQFELMSVSEMQKHPWAKMIIDGIIEWGLETQAMEISDAVEKLAVKLLDAWPQNWCSTGPLHRN